jgi:BioD-like phosphotransacetylase family protein
VGKGFCLCEGSGHAGVGSVFDLSNAQVAKILGAKVIIISQGGIGKPIDEVYLNQAVFEREDVEVIGVILNKVTPDKLEYITEFARRGLKRKGLDLLGVLPHRRILSSPTMAAIKEDLEARSLNQRKGEGKFVDSVVIGAMGAQNALSHFNAGSLVITPGDREDIIQAAAGSGRELSGMILTERLTPGDDVLRVIEKLPFPVLLSELDCYEVASRVHNLNIKTRAADTEKISVIRDLIASHVDVNKILRAL